MLGAAQWVKELPRSVEAIFIVDCKPGDRNLNYGQGGGLANSCEDARAYGREVLKAYLREYGRTAADFPLLLLRPNNFQVPFRIAPMEDHLE